MKTSDRLIVLHFTKLGDNSIVLHCLCRNLGRRGLVCRIRKGGSTALYMPLSIIDAEIAENPKSNLWQLSGASGSLTLNSIRTDLYKNAIALFMSEVLYRTVHEDAYEQGLFEWCEKSIATLEELPSGCSNFHLRWLLELCSAMGFHPGLQDVAPFAGEQLPNLQKLMELPLEECLIYPMNGKDRSDCAAALLKYLSSHIGNNLNIKSLAVLQELFR